MIAYKLIHKIFIKPVKMRHSVISQKENKNLEKVVLTIWGGIARKEEHTRGHVFVAMLAYMIVKYVTDKLKKLNFARQFIIESLDKIQYLKYQCEGETKTIIPQNLLPHQQRMIDQLEIKLR